jgi:hypothetical protein
VLKKPFQASGSRPLGQELSAEGKFWDGDAHCSQSLEHIRTAPTTDSKRFCFSAETGFCL